MAMTSKDVSELAAVLKRVSTDMTRQEITHQNGDIARVVAEGDFRVMRTFELEASAYAGEHAPALAEILNDVRAGEYTVVIAAMTSRFERRGWKALMRWMLDLDEAGGRLIAADNPSFGDLSTPMGGMLTIMTGDNDHAYSDAISKNVNRANRAIDARGGYRGGRAPLGYLSVCGVCGNVAKGETRCIHRRTKHMSPDPALVAVIIELFERIAAGVSVPVVGVWLLEVHGISMKPRGRPRKNDIPRTSTEPLPLPNSTITAMIRRPLYWTGRYQVTDRDGVVREHTTEPIVRPELWRAANASLDGRDTTKPKPRLPSQQDYSAALFCAGCFRPAYRTYHHGKIDPSGALYPSGQPKRLRRRVYYCGRCKVSWDADRADEQVQQLMSGDDTPEYDMEWIAGSDHTAGLERIRQELRDLSGRGLDDDEEDAERQRLRAERAALAALPVLPPKRELRRTGRTMGQAWDAWTHAERINYLRGEQFALDLTGHGEGVQVERVWLDNSEPDGEVSRVSDHVRGVIMTNGNFIWYD